jgi:hypothetical protein
MKRQQGTWRIFLTFCEASSATQFILSRIRNIVPAPEEITAIIGAAFHENPQDSEQQHTQTRSGDYTLNEKSNPALVYKVKIPTISCFTSVQHVKCEK